MLAVVYSVIVLGYVATSPDLGLRILMLDEEAAVGEGVQIQHVQPIEYRGDEPIEPGDTLVAIARRPVRNFLDFTVQLHKLYNAPIPPGGQLDHWIDPSAIEISLPPIVQVEDGPRMVEIQFRKAGSPRTQTAWIGVQSQPLAEVGLTFLWLVLQLAIFAVAAYAFWKRPDDYAARLFFVMCLVSTCAFVGGYHWWVIAGSQFLNTPFVICSLLVPAVTLHFFLVYPDRKRFLREHPVPALAAVYGPPVLGMLLIQFCLLVSHQFQGQQERAGTVADLLSIVRESIYTSIAISGLYFALTMAALLHSRFTTRNPIERQQLKWIVWAGVAATVPLSYTFILALSDRVGFALGSGRLPMFLASLSFMLAYAIGIVRYKLILTDEIVGKGFLYYLVSFGSTIGCGVALALGTIAPQLLTITLSTAQQVALFSVLLLATVLVFWLRDRMQRLIDRQFFREKYQLDKALQRMNRAAEHVLDAESTTALFLATCRDVLRVETSAVYLQMTESGPFQLTAVEGAQNLPFQYRVEDEALTELLSEGCLQRVTSDRRESMSAIQRLLHDLQFDLIHGLESEEGVTGFVLLRSRPGGGSFTGEDITFLNALTQFTNVALHSSKIQQDIIRLNAEADRKEDRLMQQRRQIEMLQVELNAMRSGDRREASDPESLEFLRESFKGDSSAIRGVLRTVQKVADSPSTVLIRGESGTGKEMVARLLHQNSSRRDGPLVSVHCASLSAGLLESELFGHAKGAFTGAHRDRVGRFEAAHGGTLFLDEIGDISLETQIKLLRVLQERSFEPVGSSRSVEVDVRLVTATHQDLEQLIREGRFREDLFYRLNVISVQLPPLRERKDDLIELALFFLQRAASQNNKPIQYLDDDALVALRGYDWPGNVRELENVIERAVVLAEGATVSLDDLPAAIQAYAISPPTQIARPQQRAEETQPRELQPATAPTTNSRGQVNEREEFIRALNEADGNKALAARRLGLPRSTFYSRLKKLGIR